MERPTSAASWLNGAMFHDFLLIDGLPIDSKESLSLPNQENYLNKPSHISFYPIEYHFMYHDLWSNFLTFPVLNRDEEISFIVQVFWSCNRGWWTDVFKCMGRPDSNYDRCYPYCYCWYYCCFYYHSILQSSLSLYDMALFHIIIYSHHFNQLIQKHEGTRQGPTAIEDTALRWWRCNNGWGGYGSQSPRMGWWAMMGRGWACCFT